MALEQTEQAVKESSKNSKARDPVPLFSGNIVLTFRVQICKDYSVAYLIGSSVWEEENFE
jgi:hypothetical protein